MTEKEMDSAIRKEPFEPVQLILSNGATYNVTHPDSIIIRKRMIAVAAGRDSHDFEHSRQPG